MTLKPCPFCDDTSLQETFVSNTGCNLRYILCVHCGAKGPTRQRGIGDTASEAWNRRPDTELREALEPFANIARLFDEYGDGTTPDRKNVGDSHYITLGECRKARAALAKTGTGEKT